MDGRHIIVRENVRDTAKNVKSHELWRTDGQTDRHLLATNTTLILSIALVIIICFTLST